VIEQKDIEWVRTIAERERAPFYVVGETTGDHRFVFEQTDGVCPIDLAMSDMFGSSPKTYMTDSTVERHLKSVKYKKSDVNTYIENVLQLEAVACKDWLTNKVDRSVTGKVARQQCQGEIQLPLSDCGVVALDYTGTKGIATSIGHAPQLALADSAQGSVASIAEALTNIVGAPLAQRQLDVALPQRRRGCRSLQGSGGMQRLCLPSWHQHPYWQGQPLDDAEIRQEKGDGSRHGDYLGCR